MNEEFFPYLNGTITFTSDPTLLQHAMNEKWPDTGTNKFTVSVITDSRESLAYPGCSMLSQLLPPQFITEMLMDRNYVMGLTAYYNYLGNKDLEPVISMILAALRHRDKVGKPINILLYTEDNLNADLHIFETIIKFFATNFGIMIVPYVPNMKLLNISPQAKQYRFTIAELLLNNGYIKIQRYAQIAPRESVPSNRTCLFVLQNLNYGFRDSREMVNQCLSYLDNIRDETKSGLTNPAFVMRPMDKEAK